MAEFHDSVTYGQMMAVVERLDERISGLAQEVRGLRDDVSEMRTEMRADFSEMRTEMRADSAQMRADMTGMRTEMREDMAEMRREMRADMAEMRAGLRADMTEMRSDIRHLSGRLFTLHLALWGVVGVGFTLYKLFPNT